MHKLTRDMLVEYLDTEKGFRRILKQKQL